MKQGKKALSLLAVVAFLVMALVPAMSLAAEPASITVISVQGASPGAAYANTPSPSTVATAASEAVCYAGYEITLGGVEDATYTVKDPSGDDVTVTEKKFTPELPGAYTVTATKGGDTTEATINVRWSIRQSNNSTANEWPSGADGASAWLSRLVATPVTYNGSAFTSGNVSTAGAPNGYWLTSQQVFPASTATESATAPVDGLWVNAQNNYAGNLLINATNATASDNAIKTWCDNAEGTRFPVTGTMAGSALTGSGAIEQWNWTPGEWFVAWVIPGTSPAMQVSVWKVTVEDTTTTASTVDFTPVTATADAPVVLTATLSPVDAGATFTWELTNNTAGAALTSASGAQVTLTASEAGTVDVTVTAKNGETVLASTTKTVTVTAAVPSATPTATASPSSSPTATATATQAPTVPAAPSDIPVAPGTPAATASTTPAPTESPSPSPSAEPSATDSVSPSASPSAEPTETVTAPVELAPETSDTPADLEIISRPEGEGSVLVGIEVATDSDTTSVADVSSWIAVPEDATVEIVNAEGEPVPATEPVGTGMVVEVRAADGRLLQSTTVVVKGDVTGSGVMNLTQLVRMAAAYSGTNPLTGVYAEAADLDGSGAITLTDLVIEARMFREAGLTMTD